MACFGNANATAKYMTIVLNNGSEQELVLNDEPTVSFDSYYMNVSFAATSGKSLIAFKKDDVKSYHYSESSTGIAANAYNKCQISVEDNCVKIAGAKGKATLYTANGQLIHSADMPGNGTTVISLNKYGTGVYLLNINGNTIKITRK